MQKTPPHLYIFKICANSKSTESVDTGTSVDTFPLFFVLGSHCPAATNSKTLQSSSPFQDVRRSGVRSNSTSTLDDDTATSPSVTTTVGAARQLSGAVDEMRSVDGGVATVLAAASIMDSTALSATS